MNHINLRDREYLEGFKNKLALIMRNHDRFEAYKFAKFLEKIIEIPEIGANLSPEILEPYQELIYQAKFLGLYRLKEGELFELLSEHFHQMFELEVYDILDQIDSFIINNFFHSLEKRDAFKENFLKFLNDSKILIGDKDIKIANSEEKPTVANWLNDFRGSFMEEGFLDQIKINNYFLSSKNYSFLLATDKNKLNIIISLYAKMKIPSSEVEGLEESIPVITEDGDLAVVKRGNLEKISEEVKELYQKIESISPKPVHQKVFDSEKYQSQDKVSQIKTSPERKKTIEKLLESYRSFEKKMKDLQKINLDSNLDDLLKKLILAIKDNNQEQYFSILIFFSQEKLWELFFKNITQQDLGLKFKKYLGLKFSENIVTEIINNFGKAESLSLFLQFLSVEIKLSPSESGLFGMYLANIFKKTKQEKYFPIVYGDLNLGQFVWRDIKEVAGKVQF
ncbi:hypothetical protein K8R66_01170 [bacterium]|nr:hypothetical protein [bacterium]